MRLDPALHHLPMPAALTSAVGKTPWIVAEANAAFVQAVGETRDVRGADLRTLLDAPLGGVTADEARDVVELPGSRPAMDGTRRPVVVTVVPLGGRIPLAPTWSMCGTCRAMRSVRRFSGHTTGSGGCFTTRRMRTSFLIATAT
ncbi:hypothetical protein GCM10025873_05390 [Demequina sediminis]|nr:hypothetical protein GCM10025873_05390 [Demequina sediminis]